MPLCLESKIRPGKMHKEETIALARLCLESKIRPGKIVHSDPAKKPSFALNPKSGPAR